MQIERADLSTCHTATGLAVAIDVLRAFTTAAYLFDAGVEEILLVSGVEEAVNLGRQLPGSLLLGEVDGIQIPGFDLGNSPAAITGRDFRGRRIIQRTTAGTQGVIRAANAQTILTAALTNMSATVRFIRRAQPEMVTLILTGYFPDEGWGDEDAACADAIEALLSDQPVDWQQVAERVRASKSGRHYDGAHPAFPPADLDLALQFDRFDFAMVVERANGLHRMRPLRI